MTWLLVGLGAAIGAPLRHLVDRAVQARHDSLFPWGTFTVNVVGSFVLGALAGVAAGYQVPEPVTALVGTGLCGTLSTYSTFGYDTLRLIEDRGRLLAAVNAAANVAAGLGAAFIGYALALAL